MADTSDRIIILSAVILVVIVVWTSSYPPIVSLSDIQIELETDKALYLVNEEFKVKASFYHEKSYAVRINTNIDYNLIGYTLEREGIPVSLSHGFPKNFSTIPPYSSIKVHTGTLQPRYSGEFFISCLGVNKTVLILDSESEGAIQIGRVFLDGVGRETGRVLFIKYEEKEPNFYWDMSLKSDVEWDRLDIWDRMLKWDRPEIREIRPCWVIRFEQAKRPGHFYEVWLDASEYIVVGGGQCR